MKAPLVLILAAALSAISWSTGALADNDKPNVLFVLADDMGYGDLGATGNELVDTPHLDRFAKSNHVFTSAYAPAPQCSPTRGAILTGQYPARLHITTWIGGAKSETYKGLTLPQQKKKLPPNIETLASYFKGVGYDTVQIGKWHLGEKPDGPAKIGFDQTIAFTSGAGPGKGRDWFGPYPKIKGLDGPPEEYITERLTTEAIKVIEQDRDRPFFIMLQHFDPHAPLVAPDRDIKKYVDRGRPRDEGKLNATYLAMLEQVDTSFGRLIAALEAKGELDNTIIVFFSDNGSNTWHGSNDPFRGGKKDFYEGGIRVPLIMHVPGHDPADASLDTPVSGIDFFPTLVELTGGDPTALDATLDGESLVPLLDNGGQLKRTSLFWHHPAVSRHYADILPQGAVREGPWKLIHFYGDLRPDELYNLDEDPGEENNVAKQHPERVTEMRAALEKHLDSVSAQRVTPIDE